MSDIYNRKNNTPYIYKEQKPHFCIKCGEKLKTGESVLQRASSHRTHLGTLTQGNHIMHSKHYVDAKGRPIFEDYEAQREADYMEAKQI